MPSETHSPITPATPPATEAFPYGWRYVRHELPGGGVRWEQVPLTREDVLHPQEGDQVTHSDIHQRICVYLYNVFRALLTLIPGAVVLHDVRIAWDMPELKAHGPDLAVIFGVREQKNWSTFDVAREGVRPALIIEVTSPETRSIDLTEKLEEYDLAGVPLYVIVDLLQRGGKTLPRLLAYRRSDTVYTVIPPDERGWIYLEPLKLWLGLNGQEVICYDEQGQPVGDYTEVKASLEHIQAALEAEQRVRTEAERRIQELEAELRRLRGA